MHNYEIVVPNAFVYPIFYKIGRQMLRLLHGHLLKAGDGCNFYVRNAIMYGYATCGPVRDALEMFDEMPERKVVDWNIYDFWAERNAIT
ncbi:hypothetical protein LguiB_021681 [Lonicera macranthoides]